MSIVINLYIPQADIPVSPSVYAIAQGSTLTLTFSTGGTANRYQWFKGNTAVSSISTSPNFTKTNMTAADAGVYTCRVTNTIVTDLTLSTTPITVNISACPAVDFTINGSSDTVVYVSTLDAPLALVGTPAGGTFSGNGVLGDTFYPDVPGSECDSDLPTFDSTQCVLSGGTPGPGNIAPATNPNGWPITYTYTDGMGCNVSVTKYVRLLDPTTNSWTGTASTDWLDPANWSAGIVPDATKTAFIPASATHMPVITTAGVQCKDLVIGEGASFTTAAASVVTVAGNFSNDGSFTANGTVIFSGTGAQALSGSGTITFSTLQISNATGVSLQSAISVASVLRLVNGTLTSNGHLTLLSSAARTALIDDFSTGYSGTLAGNITAQRYLPNQAVAYRYVASPVTGAQVRALAPFQNVSYYNEPQVTAAASNIDAGWVIISDTTTVINPVQGLSTYAEGNRTLFFTGTANTGVFSKTVSRTNSGNFTGYNMIGNPYPSPVSWSAIWNLNTNTHIHKTVYVWNSANNKVALYNLTTGIATNGGSNEIAQGQAFRIRVNTVGYSTTFNLDNTVRLSTSSGSFLRGEQNQVAELLRLVLSSEHDKAGYETVIHSATGATEGMDAAYDASFADDGGLDVLYSAADGEKMSINALPLLEGKRTIELGMEVQQAGEYILSATEMSHFAPGTKIYLEDRKSGRFINLETTPAYRFMADKADRNRFRLHFNPVESAEKQAARVYAFSNHIVVELDRTAPANVTVYNLLGQPVKEVTSANRGVIEFSADVPEGVYIVQVRTGAQVVRQKVFVEGR